MYTTTQTSIFLFVCEYEEYLLSREETGEGFRNKIINKLYMCLLFLNLNLALGEEMVRIELEMTKPNERRCESLGKRSIFVH